MRSFGASAPLKDLTKKFGFTLEHVVAAAQGASAYALRCQRRLTMTINAAMSDRMTFCNP